MKTDQTLLTVNNLSVRFGKEKIIDNLSFQIKKRDVFVIMGPNGAGKTTLLRALLDLIDHEGKVEWYSDKISYLPPQELLQRKSLLPLSISNFFSFKTKDKEKINNALASVDLSPSILSRHFGALSTGQFQRMIIAWALVDDPKILLFDEPTSGIDIGGEETIYSLLHKLWQERGLTILLVTHDLNIVWEHATNVLCLNKTYSCIGTPEEVLTPEQLKKLYGSGIKFYAHDHRTVEHSVEK